MQLEPWNENIDAAPLSIAGASAKVWLLIRFPAFKYQSLRWAVGYVQIDEDDKLRCWYDSERTFLGPAENGKWDGDFWNRTKPEAWIKLL